MGIRISQLPETQTIDVTKDIIPIVQEGVTKKILLDNIQHPDALSVFSNVNILSSNWNSVYTSVNPVSSNWNSVYTSVLNTSANWNSVYTSVLNTSANWNSVYTSVNPVSSNWNSVYTSVLNASASNASINYVNSNYFPITGGTITGPVEINASAYNNILKLKNLGSTFFVTIADEPLTNGYSAPFGSFGTSTDDGFCIKYGEGETQWGKVVYSTNETDGNIANITNLKLEKLKDGYNNFVLDTTGGFQVYNTINSNKAIAIVDDQELYNVFNEVVLDFTDKFYIKKSTRIDADVTIFGNLTSTGTQTFTNTIFSTTSALSVVHIGTGPAVWIGNNGTGDIASFYDIDQNIEVLHVGGVNSTYPNVGIKTSNPNKELTVNGSISSNNNIYDKNGNSGQWNSVYTILQSNSASYLKTSTASVVIAQPGDNITEKYAETVALSLITGQRTNVNRATLLLLPGEYPLNDEPIFDEEFVDVIALGSSEKKPSVFIEDGSIHVTANDVRVVGISTKGHPFDISGGPLQVFENCSGGNNSFGGGGVTASGNFVNCTGGDQSFGGVGGGDASGTFTNCIGGFASFGATTTASGNFVNCTGGEYSFGGAGGASGAFTNCTGGEYSFGGDGGIASGDFENCTGGVGAFAYAGEANGTFKNCRGLDFSFGGTGIASGIFTNCVGGADSFGGDGGTASGSFFYCRITFGLFQTPTGAGIIRLCIDGNNDVVNAQAI